MDERANEGKNGQSGVTMSRRTMMSRPRGSKITRENWRSRVKSWAFEDQGSLRAASLFSVFEWGRQKKGQALDLDDQPVGRGWGRVCRANDASRGKGDGHELRGRAGGRQQRQKRKRRDGGDKTQGSERAAVGVRVRSSPSENKKIKKKNSHTCVQTLTPSGRAAAFHAICNVRAVRMTRSSSRSVRVRRPPSFCVLQVLDPLDSSALLDFSIVPMDPCRPGDVPSIRGPHLSFLSFFCTNLGTYGPCSSSSPCPVHHPSSILFLPSCLLQLDVVSHFMFQSTLNFSCTRMQTAVHSALAPPAWACMAALHSLSSSIVAVLHVLSWCACRVGRGFSGKGILVLRLCLMVR